MLKTETITIRLSPEDKQLITNLAWKRRTSVAKLLVTLARDADYGTAEAASDLAAMKDQIDELRREIAALAPNRRTQQ